MDPHEQVKYVFNSAAQTYQEKYMDQSLYHRGFDAFCRLAPPDARVLEIGCGPGNVTRYLLARRPDLRIEGIDLAPNMVELARQNNPTARFEVLDCRDISALHGPFDALMCGFCLPYLSVEECADLFADCFALLRPGSPAYFSAMEGVYADSAVQTSSDGQYSMFIYNHEEGMLRERLLHAGFRILDFHRVDFPQPGGAVTKDLVFLVGR